jgi:O-antigen ligase
VEALILIYGIVGVGVVASLRYPIVGLFIYIGFSVLRPEALWGWAGDLHGMSRITAIPVLVGWAFNGLGSWKFGRATPIVACLLFYTGWSMLSALQAKDPQISWWALFEFTKTLLPFLVGMTMIKSDKQARQLLWVMVGCQLYVALEMNQTYLTGYNRAHDEGFGGMDNNSFAISLLSTLGGAFGLALSSKRWIVKGIAALALLLILHTILLTFSRGAFVGLIAVALTAVVIFPKRPKYLGAVLVLGLLAFRLTGPELAERLATTFEPRELRDASAESRFSLWRDCMTVIGRYPVFGVGPQNWPVVAQEFGWPPGKEAHSVWVQTAAETGLPGVGLLLLFYGLTIKRLWPLARGRIQGADRPTSMLAVGIILSLVGYAVSAQFVSLLGLEPPFYIALIGAVLVKYRTEAAPAAAPAVRPVPAALRPRAPVPRSS